MVQHIGSKFSLPKNIPLLAVAVGRSWGFQILHGHTHRMGGSGAEMHSYVTFCPPPPPSPHSPFLFSLSPFISPCTGILWITYSGKTPWGNRSLCSEVQFLKSTLMQISWNVKDKSNWLINSGDFVIFRVWHIIHLQKTVKPNTFFNMSISYWTALVAVWGVFKFASTPHTHTHKKKPKEPLG